MALFDWNRNGKDDMFDQFMDYQVYMDTFGKREEEEDENDDYIFDDYEDEEELYSDSSEEYSSHTDRSVSHSQSYTKLDPEDYFGMKEIAGKDTKEILRILIQRKNYMQYAIEFCSRESGFIEEVMDNSQMIADFWLYELSWALERSRLTQNQKIQVVDLLMKAFHVDNPTRAGDHFRNLDHNNEYYKYIHYCFDYQGTYHSFFWIILATMSGNDGERLKMTTGITKELVRFHKQLNVYLNKRFPGYGFDYDLQTILIQRLERATQKLDQTADISKNAVYLYNPLYADISMIGV